MSYNRSYCLYCNQPTTGDPLKKEERLRLYYTEILPSPSMTPEEYLIMLEEQEDTDMD